MEQNKEYYDSAYISGGAGNEYNRHPNDSVYYEIWDGICESINEDERILDLGCGVGMFAQLISERAKNYVLGVDFSSVAIEKARTTNPELRFECCDLYDESTYSLAEYDTVLVCEVLEHMENDMFVMQNIKPGARIIFTVPNYGGYAHVRKFDSEREVEDRYGEYIQMDKTTVRRHCLPGRPDMVIFVFDTFKK